MSPRGKLFILSGTTGAGKNSVLTLFLQQTTYTFTRVVTYTTREPRAGEVDGKDYHFVTDEKFDELIAQNFFLEWAHVHSSKYGTPQQAVMDILEHGEHVFLQIDVQGALEVKEKMPKTILIFIKAESLDIIRDRYIKRQGGIDPDFETRLASAKKELPLAEQYDYQIINKENKLSEAAAELTSIVDKEIQQA